MFCVFEPEFAGPLGPRTIMNPSVHPPQVSSLHIEFDLEAWQGDELLEAYPCFLVTENLRRVIERAATGRFEFDTLRETRVAPSRKLKPFRPLPKLWWIKVTGQAGQDDIGLSANHCLVVDEHVVFEMKRQCQLNHCNIYPFV
ncbi:hypothetical protein [Blastopirellula marina]|uniref:Uncharacterized protein n=1 Tax=Blastopirellula marina TaxID=124 RepID=A0A2S8F6B4_9BACT|nr:hypothetical protein [Blastopirellula marina]PQO27692.1 hypothetical protein C5Y98_26705 [Blastopirellula marina]PTL41431.1 hypothetical protein C5Y97_26720 [Blastopirellula marina]